MIRLRLFWLRLSRWRLNSDIHSHVAGFHDAMVYFRERAKRHGSAIDQLANRPKSILRDWLIRRHAANRYAAERASVVVPLRYDIELMALYRQHDHLTHAIKHLETQLAVPGLQA